MRDGKKVRFGGKRPSPSAHFPIKKAIKAVGGRISNMRLDEGKGPTQNGGRKKLSLDGWTERVLDIGSASQRLHGCLAFWETLCYRALLAMVRRCMLWKAGVRRVGEGGEPRLSRLQAELKSKRAGPRQGGDRATLVPVE